MEIKDYLKILLIILLLIALFHMPYGYYEFLRFSAMGIFIFLAIKQYQHQNNNYLLLYILLALLFQPFHKIALGRTIWNIVDVITAIFLFYTLINNKNKET